MAATEIVIRSARLAEAQAAAGIDAISWPTALSPSAEVWQQRIATFAEGQLVALLNGVIVGCMSAQRTTTAQLDAEPCTYAQLTDHGTLVHSHRPAGEIYQLVGVAVAPEGRGHRIGRRLVDRQIELARSSSAIERIVGFTRPVGYRRYCESHASAAAAESTTPAGLASPARPTSPAGPTIADYLTQRDTHSRPLDPVVAFHLLAGAHITRVVPAFRPEDLDSGGYGVMIEYRV